MGETRQYSQGKKLIQTLADKNLHTTLPSPQTLCKPRHGSEECSPRTKILTIQMAQAAYGTEQQKQKESRDKFEESFFKLMNNLRFGKTLESKRNCLTVQLKTNRDDVLRRTDTPFFFQFKISNENLAAVSSRKRSILWNKPTIVGATVMDLAKLHMFDFHYNVMKKHFNCFVLYSQTDSLRYEIKHRFLRRTSH